MAKDFDPKTYTAADTFGELGEIYEDSFDRVPAQVHSVKWLIGNLKSDAKVLDVGCGTGKPACEMLVEAGLDVTGIDITPKMIEIAKSKVPKANYEVADARTWNPPDGDASFDGIVSYFALIAAVSQAEIKEFFQRAYKWLKPGGYFVFGTVPIPGEHEQIQWLGRDIVVSGLSPEDNIEAIKAAGFAIERHMKEAYMPKAADFGICKPEDVWEETHLFVYCTKPDGN